MKRSRINPVRKKLRRGELSSAQKDVIRRTRYKMDNECCADCGRWVRWDSGYLDSMHLMHVKSKGSGGDWSMENLRTGCPECHSKRHNCGGKPVPKK